MKKKYITPVIVDVELLSAPLMTAASNENINIGIGNGTVGNNRPDLTPGQRGEWGNLWM